jgi:hypothetical protein
MKGKRQTKERRKGRDEEEERKKKKAAMKIKGKRSQNV